MTELTFKFREINKKKRAEIKIRRFNIIEFCSPILSKHSGNVIAADSRNRDFSAIEYSIDDIADAYANAVANAMSRSDINYYGSLLLAYARYYKEKNESDLIVHFCRGLLNEAAGRNENVLSYFKKLRLKWRNPYISIPREYLDFPD
jgi:hypothetical protein